MLSYFLLDGKSPAAIQHSVSIGDSAQQKIQQNTTFILQICDVGRCISLIIIIQTAEHWNADFVPHH